MISPLNWGLIYFYYINCIIKYLKYIIMDDFTLGLIIGIIFAFGGYAIANVIAYIRVKIFG